MAKTKDQKREEALERQEKYDNTPLQQKIDTIKKRPGKSKKELSKLVSANKN